MNREIRFRAWHKEKQEMLYPRRIYSFPENYEHVLELMQFTGLTDKNGKEVYESDIVEDVLRQPYLSDHKRRWLVYWREKFAGFYLNNMEDIDKPEKNQWIDLLYGGNVEHFVVIGNIYEHPNLLRGEYE